MYTVIRNYSGEGSSALFDLLEKNKSDVENLIREVSGFVSYSLIRSENGGASVTICEDKAGTDESRQVAAEWIQKNAMDLKVSPPAITEGSNILHFSQ